MERPDGPLAVPREQRVSQVLLDESAPDGIYVHALTSPVLPQFDFQIQIARKPEVWPVEKYSFGDYFPLMLGTGGKIRLGRSVRRKYSTGTHLSRSECSYQEECFGSNV